MFIIMAFFFGTMIFSSVVGYFIIAKTTDSDKKN